VRPNNGEEVHLHWANADQYYIKTGENFTDYSYKHGGWTIQFKLRNADVGSRKELSNDWCSSNHMG
jgi:adenine-specific DNA-methyltransferase